MTYVMVLEDGETYTRLEGCKIVWLDESSFTEGDEDTIVADICLVGANLHGHVAAEFGASNIIVSKAGVTVGLL